MNKVRLGLIGAGAIAKQHLEAIKGVNWIEAVGITSRTKEKAEALAREYGIKMCSADVSSLIKEAKPDALMVLVSADQMFEMVLSVIPLGLPLFIEKPAGLSPEENLELSRHAFKHSIRTMVGFNRRYYSIFRKGLQIVKDRGALLGVEVEGHERFWQKRESNKFSEPVLSNWIYANSVHTIDLLRFFGGEANNVMSIVHKLKEKNGDQFAAIMEMDSGAIGQYKANWYSPGGWRVVLYGEGVTVEFKPLEKGFWTDQNFKMYEIEPDSIDIAFKPGFVAQLEAFGRLVRDRKNDWPMQDLKGAYETMVLAKKIASDKLC